MNDLQGLALVITAVGVLFSTIVGNILLVATFIRQGQQQRAGAARDVKIKELHEAVNGQTKELKDALIGEAHSLGMAEGQTAERANPMTPAGKP